MITVYWRSKDRVIKGDLKALKSKKNVWLDCYNPTKKELEDISKITKIDVSEFKEHIVRYERPTTFESENYSLIVFGAPVVRNSKIEATSVAIFLCNDQNVVTIRTEDVEGLSNLAKELLEKNLKHMDSLSKLIQLMMERIISTYFEYFDKFQESADKLEHSIFQNPQRKSIEEVFKIRKSMLFLHKSLIANREVLLGIEKQYLSRLTKKEIHEFRDMRDDILQLIDTEDMLRAMLTSTVDIYTSSLSNQLNQAMKKLTVVASYVLIPTLIASIYGMNFRYMPEIPWKLGYPFSLGLMIVSILVVYYYFKKSKML